MNLFKKILKHAGLEVKVVPSKRKVDLEENVRRMVSHALETDHRDMHMDAMGLTMMKGIQEGLKDGQQHKVVTHPALQRIINDSTYGLKSLAKPLTDEAIETALRQTYNMDIAGVEPKGDARYNTPKEEPKTDSAKARETIEETEIYLRAKEHILKAQERQVSYGLDKYPEPLNADTWSTIETIDHIIDESVDRLHYLVMLRIKFEQQFDKEMEDFQAAYSSAGVPEVATTMQGADFDGDTATKVEKSSSLSSWVEQTKVNK